MATKFNKLVFFVCISAIDAVKSAVFAAGGGQFRPGDVANPNIRKVGTLEHVEEVRVEKCCMGEEVTKKSVAALKSAQPYEERGYGVY